MIKGKLHSRKPNINSHLSIDESNKNWINMYIVNISDEQINKNYKYSKNE